MQQCFLIRCVNPSPAAMQRMLRWGKDPDLGFEKWVSFDMTFPTKGVWRKIKKLKLAGWGVHTYTEENMEDRFPEFKALRKKYENGWSRTDVSFKGWKTIPRGPKSLAWGYHVEAILLFLAHTKKDFSYVWIGEDDIGWSGNSISTLLNAYNQSKYDLIACAEKGKPLAFKVKRQVRCRWNDCHSDLFTEKYTPRDRFKMSEHLVRLSAKMLLKLEEKSSTGVIGWSEISIPTICQHENMSFHSMREDGYVSRRYHHTGTIDKPQWKSISAEKNHQLYHPLRF